MTSSSAKSILAEVRNSLQVERVESSLDGLLVFIKGAEFPQRGIPMPEAIHAINICKKQVLEIFKVLASWQLIPAVPLVLIGWKSFAQKYLISINRIGDGTLKPYLEYMHLEDGPYPLSPFSQEVRILIETFLNELGLHTESKPFATICAHILEYDMAYRWRFLDLCTSISKLDLYEHPTWTFRYWAKLIREREVSPDMARKMSSVFLLASWCFLFPPFRKALFRTLPKVNYSRLCLDLPEFYWLSLREDYNPDSKTYEERMVFLKEKGWTVPIPDEVVI